MRLAPTSTVAASDLEANQRLIDADGHRWIIDYVVKRADKIEAFCFPEGREVSKRKSFDFKPNDTVTIQAAPEIGKGILDALIGALADSPALKGDKPWLKVEGHGDGYVLTGSKPHAWQLELEP